MSEDMDFLPKKDVLSLEELDRLCNTFIDLGVKKLRITGGEPLVRKNIMQLFSNLGKKLGQGARACVTPAFPTARITPGSSPSVPSRCAAVSKRCRSAISVEPLAPLRWPRAVAENNGIARGGSKGAQLGDGLWRQRPDHGTARQRPAGMPGPRLRTRP